MTITINQTTITLKSQPLINSDARGWLASPSGTNQDQPLSAPRFILTKPNQIRANHYHPHETETTIFLTGLWQAALADNSGDDQKDFSIDATTTPQQLVIPPLIAHAFKNLSNFPALIYHHSDQEYSKDRSIKISILN